MNKQAHICYSGMVQGVGFRYTVAGLTQGTNLTGWVKNLADGRVEILVEGPSKEIETLMQKIESRLNGYIKNKDLSYSECGGEYKKFSITY